MKSLSLRMEGDRHARTSLAMTGFFFFIIITHFVLARHDKIDN